ncbi:tRNA lysidine(34) synthetase TilS [Rhizobium sp. KVB221]|uniref:tRNA(Ile)-lysidine synthase n=1 Tax=Rhizobium setariae TaxID=2801340 RepID=A0A936YMY2_9HYPH|nr:tRNA lysidine(34) synthetase TilS [Rhizobium setariae]MBL0372453.1 tRNA lysidine(34) synthetase TilS [Rhizobium setariae]
MRADMVGHLSGGSAPLEASSLNAPESAALEFLLKLKPPCRVLIAYSGGGDSTGLLFSLASLLRRQPMPGISLAAATVDHGLRSGSAEEAENAGLLCRQFGITHHILTWRGDKPKTGIQAAAREARYRLLAQCARDIGADLLVTAHNLEDQLETHEMRKLRNPDAAGGMSEAVLIDRSIWACRPFLAVRRDDIRDYLVTNHVQWAEDPSNDNVMFERVRVRKSLAPQGAYPDFAGLAGDRKRRADLAAAFLAAHVILHAGRVAEVDLSSFDVREPGGVLALLHLIAFLGGRTHTAGRENAERMRRFAGQREETRLSIERVVLERRKQRLYITRERRSLPELVIAPSDTVVWDSRFRVRNGGGSPVSVWAGAGTQGCLPLLGGDLPADLPGSVRQRALQTEPCASDPASLQVVPIIAQFDRFVPSDLYEVANRLAILGGLAQFPEIATR